METFLVYTLMAGRQGLYFWIVDHMNIFPKLNKQTINMQEKGTCVEVVTITSHSFMFPFLKLSVCGLWN